MFERYNQCMVVSQASQDIMEQIVHQILLPERLKRIGQSYRTYNQFLSHVGRGRKFIKSKAEENEELEAHEEATEIEEVLEEAPELA